MLWNRKSLLCFPFCMNRVLSLSIHVRVPLNIIVVLNENIDTFQILFALYLSYLKYLNVSGVKQHLQLYTPSIDILHKSFKTSQHVSFFMKRCQLTISFVYGDMSVLFSYSFMNAQNLSLIPIFVAFFVMELNIRATVVGGPISKRLRISHHVTFWEHKMFSVISKFQVNTPLTNLFFTDISITLDSHESESHDTECPPFNSSSSILDDQIEHSSPTPQPILDTHPQSPDPIANPSLDTRRSEKVRHIPSHLRDFHCTPLYYHTMNLLPIKRQCLTHYGKT